jgi:hypothetical protein
MNAVLHVKPKRGEPKDFKAALGVAIPRVGDFIGLPKFKRPFRVSRIEWRYGPLTYKKRSHGGLVIANLPSDELTPRDVHVWLEAT